MGYGNDLRREKLRLLWQVKKKDICEECGTRSDLVKEYDEDGYLLRIKRGKNYKVLTVHHIDGNIENNEDTNLQTLCRECHDYKHRMRK